MMFNDVLSVFQGHTTIQDFVHDAVNLTVMETEEMRSSALITYIFVVILLFDMH